MSRAPTLDKLVLVAICLSLGAFVLASWYGCKEEGITRKGASPNSSVP